jgi:hypothetical protein
MHALELMREFEATRRLDFLVPESSSDPRLSFANLFPSGRGNMFGVLECEDETGQTVVLRAFSSLRDGIRQVDGWVPPILSAEVYEGMILPAQREIKLLSREMDRLEPHSSEYLRAHDKRKGVSQELWENMCASYRFHNFRGEGRSLENSIWPKVPAPGGVGECCAPKLLNHAALRGLRPRGLAEFYWGSEDSKMPGGAHRVSRQFYASCEARCRPILGFMLCGIDE